MINILNYFKNKQMKIEIEVKDNEIFVNSEKFAYIGRALNKVESLIKNETTVLKVEEIANKLCGGIEELKKRRAIYRQVFCYLCRKENIQLNYVGECVDYESSTVCTAAKKIKGYIDINDKQTLKILEEYELS